jgi:hypothetical protein
MKALANAGPGDRALGEMLGNLLDGTQAEYVRGSCADPS